MKRRFEVMFRDRNAEQEVIECDHITWLSGWVTFTTAGFLDAAYPADLVTFVSELPAPTEDDA